MKSEPFTGRSGEMREGTPWLASEDILDCGDVAVEIEAVFHHKGAVFDEGRQEDVFALKFKGKQKQLVLNATNRKRLVKLFGTSKTTEWVGKTIILYVDHNVRKPGGSRGEKTCGIRIREQLGGTDEASLRR
jgi:hypothetical protein